MLKTAHAALAAAILYCLAVMLGAFPARSHEDLIKPSLDEHYHLCEGTMYTTSPMTPGGAKSEPFPRCLYAPSPAF